MFLLLSLVFAFVGCSGKLTTREVRIGVLSWVQSVRYYPPGTSGTLQISSDSVDNNTGEVVIKGIQESPQDNTAKADIEFNNFKYEASGAERSYSGTGVATFSRYNDGTWTLKKVSIPGKDWENINIKAE